MSEFWKYFKDTLRWPLIHKPGPLAALLKGKAHALDETRDDILHFRRQWFPEHCEEGLVSAFGNSRRIIRHPRESAAQFRQRVVKAYAWHLLGGKVEGLPQILEFYGLEAPEIINLRRILPSKWATFQLAFKTTQNSQEQAELLANLDLIIWLVNEYKPARSLLFRVYTDNFNMEPGVWSGPLPRCSWSNAWWSHFSGAEYPDPGNPQGGVLVSLGLIHRFQSEAYLPGPDLAAIWQERHNAFLLKKRALAWSATRWSEKFPSRRGFFGAMLYAAHAADKIHVSLPWSASPWPDSPWATEEIWDRKPASWRMFDFGIAKSQGVYSDASDKRDNVWSGLNACWSPPYFTLKVGKPPHYSEDKWSDKKEYYKTIRILERFIDRLALASAPFAPRFDDQSAAYGESLLSLGCTRKPAFYYGKSCWSGGKRRKSGGSCIVSALHTLAGKEIIRSDSWEGGGVWPQAPWGVTERYGREYPQWSMEPGETIFAVRIAQAGKKCASFGEAHYGGIFGAVASNYGAWPDKAWNAAPWGGSAALPPARETPGMALME